MYHAIVAFKGPTSFQIQIEGVGVYETREKAEHAINDFIEDVLEIERPGYEDLVSKIVKL